MLQELPFASIPPWNGAKRDPYATVMPKRRGAPLQDIG
jgi:hypothetical protein